MKGLCPFHDEKTPVVQRQPARGFYHCFGCGEGGDVITFVQKIEGLSVHRGGRAAGRPLRRRSCTTRTAARRPAPRRRAARPAARGAPRGRGVLRRAAHRRPRRWPGRTFLRPSAASTAAAAEHVRRRLRAPRAGRRCSSTCAEGLHRRRAGHGGPGRAGRTAARTTGSGAGWCGRSASVTGDVVGFGARRLLRRRPGRRQVPEHARDADLQEEPGALRRRPRQARDRAAAAGSGRRGLHRRDGVPPLRRHDRGGDVRHRVRRGPHHASCAGCCSTTTSSAARSSSRSTATRPGRRRRCAPSASDQQFVGADLRCRRARRARPVRPADRRRRCRRARADRPPGSAVPLRAQERRLAL